MRHTAHLPGQFRSFLNISETHPSPAVTEDLATDLLSQDNAIGFPTSGGRCLDSFLQIGISAMLGRNVFSSPPEETCPIRDDIPHPFSHFFGGDFTDEMILQNPWKEQRTIDVIICRKLPVIEQVASDWCISLSDQWSAHSFNRSTKPYPDAFA